jgi:peptidoglycan hydrolase-like protein with peptidoglycan-binding domain
MGASTRAAIEKFERDRKLPVKGEPSPRTFRELATRAGATRG